MIGRRRKIWILEALKAADLSNFHKSVQFATNVSLGMNLTPLIHAAHLLNIGFFGNMIFSRQMRPVPKKIGKLKLITTKFSDMESYKT